jgi:ferric-dicitrate binding protein FerR (iron transport regulator)
MAGVPRDRDRGCRRAREWVSLRLDGELSELERLLLRRHLGRCPECRAVADGFEAATRLIRATPRDRPALSFQPAPAAARPQRRVRLAAVAGLAALAAGVGVGIGVLIGSSGDAPVPTAPGPTQIVELPPGLQPPSTNPPTVNV